MDEIINAFLSGEGKKICEAKKEIDKIRNKYYKELWGEQKEKPATNKLRKLRDKFIKLSESKKENERLAGIKGLGTISYTTIFSEKIDKMIELFFKTIVDDNGQIRFASANAFGHMRSIEGGQNRITEELYAEVYLTMIDLLDAEENPKKRKSIEIALGNLYCPMLETILFKLGYERTENS
jgi:hypothetical protein